MQDDPERVTYFARTDARGSQTPFGIKSKDRARHMYVIGKTGMGKSTMLENMAVQDIKNGEGVAFIDPHGSTAEKILEYVPKERLNDVVYFAPFDMEYPISFNVMEDVGPDKRHLVVSGLMSTFKKIWVDAWSARMEYILSNTLLALLEYPDSTLLGVNRMLSDKKYREAVVDNITDPSVKSFWVDEFAKYNERYMQEAGDAIKNKIGQFTANPLIRNIIGQPKSSFDIREVMDERKILIMNLSKGLVGEVNANLLGSMLITRIYLSAMSRADLPAQKLAKMPNLYFYVDEFQSFANETFANILSEARKYKLNLIIAHQYIEQMEEDVRNAVFGNVGTTVTFRVGPFDAESLEPIFSPQFMATDLVNLGFAQIYLTLMIDGIGSQPFSAVTLPPIPQADESYVDQIVDLSRKQYAEPRAVIEAAIEKWHEPVASPKKESHQGQSGASHTNGNHNTKSQNQGSRQSGGNGSSGNGDRGKRNQGRGGRQEVTMESLRNTLKDIVGNQTESPEKKQEKKQEKVKQEKQTSDLKNALAAALGKAGGADKKEGSKTQKNQKTPEVKKTQKAEQKPKTAKPVSRPAEEKPEPARSSHARSDVPEDMLKNMLRVTEKDIKEFKQQHGR